MRYEKVLSLTTTKHFDTRSFHTQSRQEGSSCNRIGGRAAHDVYVEPARPKRYNAAESNEWKRGEVLETGSLSFQWLGALTHGARVLQKVPKYELGLRIA